MENTAKNKVELTGFIGQDPRVFTFNNGNKKASFSLATSEGYRDKNGQWVNNTSWHNIVAFGKVAEDIENNVAKGKKVNLTGKIGYRQYEDKSGQKRTFTEISASEIQIIE